MGSTLRVNGVSPTVLPELPDYFVRGLTWLF
jgi:hypothetical protein